jgi:peptidoglycan biosynthesis protein MviN/MurJ (putative lipid II flippase)
MNASFNLILNLAFYRVFGVAGIALSSSVTLGITQLLIAWRLARVEDDFEPREILRLAGRVLLASAVPALVVAVIAWSVVGDRLDTPANLVALVALTLVGAIGYLGMARLLGINEPTDVIGRAVGSIRSWLRR